MNKKWRIYKRGDWWYALSPLFMSSTQCSSWEEAIRFVFCGYDTRGKGGERHVKIRAPFHVGDDYGFNWLLFAFRAEFNQLDRVQWDYWQVQKLATQGEQLRLRHEAEKAIKRRRLNKRAGRDDG